jgi:hypothetical protein
MDFDFSTRLSWFDVNHYQYGYRVIVTEPAEEGKAEVTFVSSKKLLSVKTDRKKCSGLYKVPESGRWHCFGVY